MRNGLELEAPYRTLRLSLERPYGDDSRILQFLDITPGGKRAFHPQQDGDSKDSVQLITCLAASQPRGVYCDIVGEASRSASWQCILSNNSVQADAIHS